MIEKEYIIKESQLIRFFNAWMFSDKDPSELHKICDDIRSHDISSPDTTKSLAEMPTLHDKERYMQGYREGVVFQSQKDERKMIAILEEIESGILAYEREHKHQQVVDDCKGIYIPFECGGEIDSEEKGISPK